MHGRASRGAEESKRKKIEPSTEVIIHPSLAFVAAAIHSALAISYVLYCIVNTTYVISNISHAAPPIGWVALATIGGITYLYGRLTWLI